MFAQKKLTVTANTPKDSPASVEFTLTPGLMETIWIHFPDGCNQMVHVVILHDERQIVPKDENETIAGNDYTYALTQALTIIPGHEKFTARGWSPGTTFDHNILISFDTYSEEEKDVSETFLGDILGVLKKIGVMVGAK